MYFSEQGNVDDDATLITIFFVSFNLQSCCLMQSAVCGLQSANVMHRSKIDVANHSCLGYTETVFPRLSRHTVFPNSTKLFILCRKCKKSKACLFILCRIVDFYLSNRKTSTLFLDFVSSCLLPSWNTIHLKSRFHSNRKPEIGIMQDFYSLSISLSIVKYIWDPFLDPCRFCLYQWFT